MARASLRQFSSAKRREGLPWSASLWLLLAALLVNYVGLYGTGTALALALEPVPLEREDEALEFDLVEGDSPFDSPERLADHEGEGSEPSPDLDEEQRPESSSRPDQRDRARGVRGRGERGDHAGELDGAGVGEAAPGDSLVVAPDGELDGEGGGSGGVAGKPDPLARLGGSPSVLNETFGPIRPDDAMRDIDEGVDNVLQSKRHVFGSFFNRFRDGVYEHWRPGKVHEIADPTQTKYGTSPRTTVLMLRLDEKGEILKIVIIEASGAPHLDAEAIRALKAAGPFPNPPRGLADERGYIELPIGMTLEFGRPSRIFRW